MTRQKSQGRNGLVKPRRAGSLKEAQEALINRVGGLDRAAELASRGRSTVQRYSDDSDDHRDCHMPVHIVRMLELDADEAIVSRWLAAERGYLLHRACPEAAEESIERGSADLAKEASAYFANLAAAMADGKISTKEAGLLLQGLDRWLTVGMALRARLAAARDQEEV